MHPLPLSLPLLRAWLGAIGLVLFAIASQAQTSPKAQNGQTAVVPDAEPRWEQAAWCNGPP